LGFDFSGFINSTIFGGMEGGRKSFALLTDAERKRVLDSFLRFEQFDNAQIRARELRLADEKKVLNIELERRDTAGLLKGSKSSIDFLSHRIKEQKSDDRKQISILKRRLKRLHLSKEVSAGRLRKQEKLVWRKSETLGRSLSDISRLEDALSKLKRQLDKREKLVGRKCSACGQRISEKAIGAFRKAVKAERDRLRLQLQSSQESAQNIRREVAHGRSKLKRLQHRFNSNLNTSKKRGVIQREINKLVTTGVAATPLSIQLESLVAEYSRKLSRLLVLDQQKAQLENSIKDYRFWEEGFGNKGVKALIVREILPTLNNRLAKYSQEIFEDGTTIQLSATQETKSGEEKELLNIKYQSPSGADSYIGESSGGRRRADLCVLLVFSWLARASNVLFVDEFFDHLDAAGRERALDILQRQRGSIFIVTHERGLKGQLSKVWTVAKEHRASRVEVSQ
jgi:DNA repair exonuclease SbcCD ATPase subunit